jgi:hypothetical protein
MARTKQPALDPTTPRGAEPAAQVFCLVHGVELRSNGWCGLGKAYASNAVCPFTCPICRGPLDWKGGCGRCHGCTTGEKADWTFPGDRYERDDDNPGHFEATLKAGRAACTPRENVGAMQLVQAVLAKKLALAEALGHLGTIFSGRETL